MNNLIRRFILILFCSPALLIALLALIAILTFAYSFTFQYFDKYRLPVYAEKFPLQISTNSSWIDSISTYSIERRSKNMNGLGEISMAYSIISDCKSIVGVEFAVDTNYRIIDSSFEFRDVNRGLKIGDSLLSCEIDEIQLSTWKDRVKFLHDTLHVGKIWTDGIVHHFQFGSDIIIKKQQQSQYQCSDGVMFKEIQIDNNWKILRNCVTF